MKLKYVLIALTVWGGISSCDDDDERINYLNMAAPDVQLVTDEVPSAAFGESIAVAGTVNSEVGIRDIGYTLMKKDGSGYASIGLEKYYLLDTIAKKLDFSIPVLIEDDEVAAVEVTVTDVVAKSSKALFVISSITGVPQGGAYVFNLVEMAPEYERPADPVQPCLFSATGVNVNGTVKNVLTLKEAKDANSRGIDFAFINMWKNTQTNPPTASSRLGNRGFAFCDVSQLGRGPIGRQCDLEWLPKRDTTCMFLVSDNIASAANLSQLFETASDNWKTYKALDQIPEFYTTWTVGTNYNVFQRSGSSADNTTACSENLKNGSFIVFRRQNNKNFKYGIIQILEAANDKDVLADDGCKIPGDDYTKWYTGPNLPGLTYNGVAKLYGRKVKMKIIVQK